MVETLIKTKMAGVIEFNECMPVILVEAGEVASIKALNEGGHNSTEIDLRSLLVWLKMNRPELLEI